MKSNKKAGVIVAVAIIALGGAAWLAAQNGVGAGKTVHVFATPT